VRLRNLALDLHKYFRFGGRLDTNWG